MRVEINERLVQRRRRFAQYAFFATLALLLGGFFIITVLPPTPVLLLAPFLLLPITFGATLFSVRMTNTWLREPTPDKAMQQGFKGLARQSAVYHHWFPAPHVLIAPQGIFTFTVRGQEGNFVVNEAEWSRLSGSVGKLMAVFRQDGLGHPFRDAEREAAAMQAFIDEHVPESGVTVQPVVVFLNPRTQVEVTSPTIPVVHAENKKRPSLKALLKRMKKQGHLNTLDEEQMEILEEAAGFEFEYEYEDDEDFDGEEYDDDDEE